MIVLKNIQQWVNILNKFFKKLIQKSKVEEFLRLYFFKFIKDVNNYSK